VSPAPQPWKRGLLELAVVVVSILLAFQVDRMYENWREDQLETRYLERLILDLRSDTVQAPVKLLTATMAA